MKLVKMQLSSIAALLAALTVLMSARLAEAQTAPTFKTQPVSVSTTNGATVIFKVSAAGTLPMVSLWSLNGALVYSVTNQTGSYATNNLVLYGVTTNNAGAYTVVIINDWGGITSSVATLTVTNKTVVTPPGSTNTPPTFLAQPLNIGTTNGGTATFKVAESGSPDMVAQWFYYGALVSGITNTGALYATNTLVLTGVTTNNDGAYFAIVYNNWGSITSAVVTLTVTNAPGSGNPGPGLTGTPPAFLLQPQGLMVTNGGTATFKASFFGSPDMVSQWLFNGQYVSGVTNTGALYATNILVLTDVTSSNAGAYQVVVTNDWGSITSIVATLTISNVITSGPDLTTDLPPIIDSQPQSLTTVSGSTATFNIIVSGSPDMVAQWYLNGQYLSGTTNLGALTATNSLVLPAVTTSNAGNYTVVITNNWGSVTSSVATLTVTNSPNGTNTVPTIATQPQNLTVTNGTPFAQFSVIANGTQPLTCQWYFNGQLACTVTNLFANLYNGATTGYCTSNSLPLYNICGTNAGNYQVVITNLWGSVTSSVATLTVTTNAAPAILAQPQSITTTSGGSATFAVSFDGTPVSVFGVPSIYTQWYFDGQALTPPETTTGGTRLGVLYGTNTLQLSDVLTTNAGSYYAILYNSWGSVTSSIAILTITNLPVTTNNAPTILAQPQSVSTTNGATVTFKVTISGATNLVSEWYFNGALVSITNNPGKTLATNSLVLPGVSTSKAGAYIVIITNDWGSVTSSIATLSITNTSGVTNTPPPVTNSAPVILAQPQSLWATNRQNVILKTIFTGSTNLAAQWYFNGAIVSGTTDYNQTTATNSLLLTNVSSASIGNYQVIITNNWGSVTSSIAMLNITNAAGITNSESLTLASISQISLLSITPAGVTLNLYTTPGISSQIWATTNLVPPVVWQSIGSNTPGTDGMWQFTDTNAGLYPFRFYRTSTP